MNSVNEVWNTSELDECLIRVFHKLKVVFCNILRGGGGNDLVEANRGKKNRNVKIENVLRQIEKENEEDEVIDLLNYDGFDEVEEGTHQI